MSNTEVISPTPFGKYYLLERINVGGMAEVFRAKAFGVEGFERLLAVKRILPNIAKDEEFIDMFIDEAKIAVQLNHANVGQIFDLGKVDGSFFIAMEYIHGVDLRAIFDVCRSSLRRMPISQACFIIMKVCEGLDYAHNKRDASGREMNIVHRDISPQNVLVSYEGEVKLIDFGIAKAAGRVSRTQAGILKGKFGYMSPEQVRGLPLDRRSDIFSVGIILYELLTGERLFHTESDFSTLEKVRNVEILPPSAFNRQITDDLEQIVFRALAKDVEDRYQNAIDLHDDLQAYMYTSGDFFSRKDLAAWMKQQFSKQISEEERKIEAYQQLDLDAYDEDNYRESQKAYHREAHLQRSSHPSIEEAAELMTNQLETGHLDAVTAEGVKIVPLSSKSSPVALPLEDDIEPADDEPEELETRVYPRSDEAHDTSSHVSVPAARETLRSSPSATLGTNSTFETQHEAQSISRLRKRLGHRVGAWRRRQTLIGAALVLVVLGIGASFLYALSHVGESTDAGKIRILGTLKNVEISIDGQLLQQKATPLTVKDVPAGLHTVSIRKTGYEKWQQVVQVTSGRALRLKPVLTVMATAIVELRTRPTGAEVYLDDVHLSGITPMRIARIAPGQHQLELRKEGYLPYTYEFEIGVDQRLNLSFELVPRHVQVKLVSNPSGQAFLVREGREKPLGRTPLSLELDRRLSYQVVIRQPGHKPWRKAIQFQGSQSLEIVAKLERLGGSVARVSTPRKRVSSPPAAAPKRSRAASGTGTLLVNSNPWTKIFVDGKDTGLTTPQRNLQLPSGTHRITLKNERFGIDETFTVRIRANRPTRLIKTFQVQGG